MISAPAGARSCPHLRGLRPGPVAVTGVIVAVWGRPAGAVVLLAAILLAVVPGLIELIIRPRTVSAAVGPAARA